MNKLNKIENNSFFAILITVCCFVASRALNIASLPEKSYIIEAMGFTILTFLVYLLVSKSKNVYFGILSGAVAFVMMPPNISGLKQINSKADIVYFIVNKFAYALFIFAIIMQYRKQEKKNITALPILGVMFVIPFCNQVGDYIGKAFVDETGSMYGYYASIIAMYAIGLIMILLIGVSSKKDGLSLVSDFEIIVLSVKAGQKIVAVAINYFNENYINKAYYWWIALYVVFIIIFALAKEKSKKMSNK